MVASITIDRGTFVDFPESVPMMAEALATIAGMRIGGLKMCLSHRRIGA